MPRRLSFGGSGSSPDTFFSHNQTKIPRYVCYVYDGAGHLVKQISPMEQIAIYEKWLHRLFTKKGRAERGPWER